MKAINSFIVIEKLKDEPKKIAGLIMTESTDTDTRYDRAKVISAGDLVEAVKEGDIIQYDKHAGSGISVKNAYYYVISIRDVVIVE
jgi:co-chaperonin GroES (HSP10)|tara:strand:+ start:241 stop:498 length:258 start_codon:yes stop_codon:yes gene_type:complete